jgi:hypothetical protein
MEMERGKLNIERIPQEERWNYFSSDYDYQKAKKEGFRRNTFYPIPSLENRTSRRWWLDKDGLRVRVVFFDNKDGYLDIWELPQENERYVIGATGAIDAENKPSAIEVLNVKSLSQAAEFSVNLAPYLFAIEIFKLSIFYNDALIASDNSDDRHGLSIITSLMIGNNQYDVLPLNNLYQKQVLDKIKNRYVNKVGFEMKPDRKGLIFDNLFAVLREGRVTFNSQKLIKELQIPNVMSEGYKTDWANRAYAMAICYEMARLYPYRKPQEAQEIPDCSISNMP